MNNPIYNKPLTGKIAVVTDGHYGIGALSAQTLADQGANVIISHPANAWNAAGIVTGLEARGVNARAYAINCDHISGIKALVAQVIKDFGQVDILVTNTVSFVLQDDERLYSKAAIDAISPVIRNGGRIITIGNIDQIYPAKAVSTDNTSLSLNDLITDRAKSLYPRHVTVNRLQSNFRDRRNLATSFENSTLIGELTRGLSFLAGPEADFITGTTFNFDSPHARHAA
ncbi:SDR family NAD(P)-dependent oxidoreductase [Thalassospira profundimaris]|uniref:SDR family NAD(P)-dependent oxidoreductase n=1 Tax=Thalassospira profundimaris TaxID=502049 RepID=UPI0015F01D5B|nr:SDR family NAD(P)-dependent oxidoreductase [Thalassospira profundimaris]